MFAMKSSFNKNILHYKKVIAKLLFMQRTLNDITALRMSCMRDRRRQKQRQNFFSHVSHL